MIVLAIIAKYEYEKYLRITLIVKCINFSH